MIAARQVAPSEVMAAHLDRIAAENPAINAIVSLRDRDELMAEARAADDAAPAGWLHGMPLAVKDLCATKGLRTTWGSPLFADFVPAKDDLLAARMRAAGAIFIGKTNTPEWGHGSHSFNPVHGVTRNPYDLTRTAGGSSGGAAAALAARMVPVADGSDMMGQLAQSGGVLQRLRLSPDLGAGARRCRGRHLSGHAGDRRADGRARSRMWRGCWQVQAGPEPRGAVWTRRARISRPAGRRPARQAHRLAGRLGRRLSDGAGDSGAVRGRAAGVRGSWARWSSRWRRPSRPRSCGTPGSRCAPC